MLESLEEKEILLKEVHHRVKNNLQIISSLLDLQAENLGIQQDAKILDIFRESKNRIRSMTLIHETLYQSDHLAKIDVSAYIRELVDYFSGIYGKQMERITTRIQSESIFLDMDRAIPLGLILTELLTNAFKHAFPNGARGAILIRLHSHPPGTLILAIQDNGIGLTGISDVKKTQSLGLQLVTLLTKQLNGNLKVDNHAGTVITITFPSSRGKESSKK